MKQGLEIFDKAGRLVFDSNSLTTRVLGTGRTYGVDNFLTDENIRNGRVWVKNSVIHTMGNRMPLYTVEGNTISWRHYMPLNGGAITWDESSLTNSDCSFIYGTF